MGDGERVDTKIDMLQDIFDRQVKFMEVLKINDKIPEWPIDLTTKPGQRLIKETMFNMHEELFEASYTLKNKMHRLTDVRVFDVGHYREELGDALAFFVEICILSDISPRDLYEEYCRKNGIVLERIQKGY